MGMFKKNRASTQSEHKPFPVPNFHPTEYGVVGYKMSRIIMVRLNPQACGQDWEMIGQEITSAAWQKKRERATINANQTDRPGLSVEDTYLGPYGAMVRCDNQVGFYFQAPGDLALTPFPLRGTDGSVFHRYSCGPYEHRKAFLRMMYAPDATNTCANCALVSDSDRDSRFRGQIIAFDGLIDDERFDSDCLVARKGPDESIVLA